MKNNKLLIALEGADCAGKSNVMQKLKSVLPVIYPDKKFLFTREPGNLLSENNKSEEIRKELLNNSSLSGEQQAQLFADSRLYHTKDIIEKLNNDYIIITDRYLLSSYIYQGDTVNSQLLLNMNKESCNLLNKNNIRLETIVFKITEDTYNNRMNNRNGNKDAMENVALEKIRKRINKFNCIENQSSLKDIDDNNVTTIDANGNDYSRIFIDVLYHIDKILNK